MYSINTEEIINVRHSSKGWIQQWKQASVFLVYVGVWEHRQMYALSGVWLVLQIIMKVGGDEAGQRVQRCPLVKDDASEKKYFETHASMEWVSHELLWKKKMKEFFLFSLSLSLLL